VPPSGSKAIFVGDSISDPNNATGIGAGLSYHGGQYAGKLSAQYGWRMLGANMLGGTATPDNATSVSFETDTNNWIGLQATLASDATHGGSSVTSGSGSKAMKVTPTVNSSYAEAIPEGDLGGDATHGLRVGMQAGVAYTFAADVYVPLGTTGQWTMQIWDTTTAGSGYVNTSVNITPMNAWQRVSVTRTIQVSAVEAAVRIANYTAAVTQPIWVDCVQIEPGAVANPWFDSSSGNLKPAMGGTLLQATDNTASNFNGNQAGRFTNVVTAAGGVDLICMYFGTNDLGGGLGSFPNRTRTTWRDALVNAMGLFTTVAPAAQIVLISLGSLTTYAGGATVPQWTASSAAWIQQQCYVDMNNITQQIAQQYGAAYVDITGGLDANTVDHIHPNQAGHDYIVTRFKAAFAQ
jgi:lysophospholipase L1-like esterase